MLRSVLGFPRLPREASRGVCLFRPRVLEDSQLPLFETKAAARARVAERWCLYSGCSRELDVSSATRARLPLRRVGVGAASDSAESLSNSRSAKFVFRAEELGVCAAGRRWFSGYYSPRAIRCRNRPLPLLLQTGEPPGGAEASLSVEALSSRAPYTLAKQERLLQQQQLGEGKAWKLFRGRVVRQLSVPRVKHGGRNATGQITVRHQGGGHAQRVRLMDYRRSRKDIWATVLRLEHDPRHSSGAALLQYDDGVLSYIPAAAGMRPGDRVVASVSAPVAPGCSLPLLSVPVGSVLHAIELRPGQGAQLARAAGAFATLVSKDASLATLRLPSGELRAVPLQCWASIGQALQPRGAGGKKPPPLGKAGASRWRGVRPSVRGKAMNACKHPHGGGTSQKRLGRCPVSAWGILRNGYKTRSKAKPLGLIVRRRRSAKFVRLFGGNA